MDDKQRRIAPATKAVTASAAPTSVGDVLNDLARMGELPAAGALTLPSTSASSLRPSRSTSISTTRICECGGFGLLTMGLVRAREEQLVIVDSYELGTRMLALIPCICAAGQERAARWRGLPEEAEGVKLRGGRVKKVDAQAKALEAVKTFIKQPRGWVTLAGGYGVGKTTLIYASLNHLADKGIFGRYVMMPDLLDELRTALRRDDQTYASKLHRIVEAPILAVDELDKVRDSNFVDEVLHAIFLARYQERGRLGTLIGYNLDGAANIPAFLASRIRDSRFHLVEMGSTDLRPIAAQIDPWDKGEGEP
jgi:DNA replication protein DnaC